MKHRTRGFELSAETNDLVIICFHELYREAVAPK
jgi:hypothetical protein